MATNVGGIRSSSGKAASGRYHLIIVDPPDLTCVRMCRHIERDLQQLSQYVSKTAITSIRAGFGATSAPGFH